MLLTEEDFDTHLYGELIEAIKRDDEDKLEKAIKAAEAEAKSYLSRYNINSLFSAQGDERDDMLLMYIKDLAAWHFIVIANPNIDISFQQMRYEYAVKELEKIQSGKKIPFGWPDTAETEEGTGGAFFKVSSNPRRETRF